MGHETAWTFQPINEYRAKPGTRGRANQDRYWLTGYYGRGYVQLTWKANYEKAGRALGVDLVNRPELALEPEVAFKILFYGMRSGWFTGKKLSDYIRPGRADYVGARKIINGEDKAEQIASYAGPSSGFSGTRRRRRSRTRRQQIARRSMNSRRPGRR